MAKTTSLWNTNSKVRVRFTEEDSVRLNLTLSMSFNYFIQLLMKTIAITST